jgi:pimeloyl-ACP methyl ester carboxylesterase
MLDLVDLLLLRRGIPADDRTVAFRRVDGNSASKVIYFLPWHTPLAFARQAGFAPLDFLACYEMPPAIVSSDPALCRQSMLGLVSDAERLLAECGLPGRDAVIVGLSIGTYPATYLANKIGARLCSVASADRGDVAIWDSPATRIVRRRAMEKGFRQEHYAEAFSGTHPSENLTGIAPGSMFVMGRRDPYVPPRCKTGLLRAIEMHAPRAQVIQLDAGHFKTMMVSGRHQRRMPGVEAARARWPLRISLNFALAPLGLFRPTSAGAYDADQEQAGDPATADNSAGGALFSS